MKLMTDCGMGVILADDMGLGKTLQILTLLLAHKESLQKAGLKPRPSLIVVPTSLTYNWVAEIEKFTPSLTVQTLTGTPSQREALLNDCQDTDILLTTYGMIRRDAELYEGIEFEYCILDESQHIKNPMSIGAKGVKTIRAKKRIAMTGTPIENNIIELWSVFDFIMPGFFGSLHKFNKRFANGNEEDVTRTLRAMTSPFIIRRIKSDVLEELPEKIITKMDCELTQEQKELYMAYLTLAKQQISSDEDINQKRFSILSTLLRLRQICCHPSMFIDNYKGGSGKIELFNEVVEQAVTSGHRVLVFSQFTSMLDILKKELDKQGFTYFYLDGTVPANERIDSVNRFNEGERQLFLISLKAGGFGLNLTGADVVIHYDPWWNPAVENQATDRAHRIGQKKTVHVIRLVAKGTIEDKILSLQDKKQALVDSILEAGDSVPNRLDLEEILELLQTE
jgi:SNF2 family DNA or RNA helicase